jgi:hypothetical protein
MINYICKVRDLMLLLSHLFFQQMKFSGVETAGSCYLYLLIRKDRVFLNLSVQAFQNYASDLLRTAILRKSKREDSRFLQH